eukprot:731500-Rhodomonas_salina.3
MQLDDAWVPGCPLRSNLARDRVHHHDRPRHRVLGAVFLTLVDLVVVLSLPARQFSTGQASTPRTTSREAVLRALQQGTAAGQVAHLGVCILLGGHAVDDVA